MPTITSTSTFAVGTAAVAYEETSVTVVSAGAGGATGRGRLVHPTLGTLDYDHPPTEWSEIDGDVVTRPTFSTSKALIGSASTLWRGNIRDVECVETWGERGQLRMTMGQFRTMLAFYQAPPDPAVGYVEWYPSYCTSLGYRVLLTDLTVGGQGITLDWVSQQSAGFVADRTIKLVLKICGRVP